MLGNKVTRKYSVLRTPYGRRLKVGSITGANTGQDRSCVIRGSSSRWGSGESLRVNSIMLRKLVRRLTGTQPMRRRINGSPGSSIAVQIGASRKNSRREMRRSMSISTQYHTVVIPKNIQKNLVLEVFDVIPRSRDNA